MNVGIYGTEEQVFEPFQTAIGLKQSRSGRMNCYGKRAIANNTDRNAPCAWLQYWVELASAGQAGDYLNYLTQYSQQHDAGRYERPPNARLRNVMDWLLQPRRAG